MGQYFKLVNLDKKEVVVSYDIKGSAKFYEWLYNNQARVLVWLLRQSNEGGGGDICDFDKYKTLGRWAGDRITLVGDYDRSGLYDIDKYFDYKNISKKLLKEYNKAVKKDGFIRQMGL